MSPSKTKTAFLSILAILVGSFCFQFLQFERDVHAQVGKRLSDEPATTTLSDTDIMYVVKNPGAMNVSSNKISVGNFKQVINTAPIAIKNGGGTTLVAIDGNGQVGIGTDSPQEQLDVELDAGVTIRLGSHRNAVTSGDITLVHGRGTRASPIPLQADDNCGQIYFNAIESDGVERHSASIYSEYGGDDHGRLYLGVNNTPNFTVTVSSGPTYGGLGVNIDQAGREDPTAGIDVIPQNGTMPAGRFQGNSPQTANLVEVKSPDGGTLYSGFSPVGLPFIVGGTAPADGNISNGQSFIYFDATAGQMKWKGKKNDGTVVTGTF